MENKEFKVGFKYESKSNNLTFKVTYSDHGLVTNSGGGFNKDDVIPNINGVFNFNNFIESKPINDQEMERKEDIVMENEKIIEFKPIPKINPLPSGVSLEDVKFVFTQEANCCDGGEYETLIVEAKSSLGISADGGAFFVLKTEQWAVDEPEDIFEILQTCKNSISTFLPK